MKQIQVEAITVTETIKPSTPTPHHLRRHKLSFFDQVEPPRYMNTILYFSSDPSKTKSHISNTLKTSLAQILSIYYPLAGRVADDNLYVECHDQGAYYQEANVKGSLYEIMSDLDPSELSKFLSYDTVDVISAEGGGPPLLVVQVNFFECGGVVIGLLMYHKVGDALSLFTFLNNWASVARNDDRGHFIVLPDFSSAAKLFPSVDLNGWQPAMNGVTKEERVSRRFVFSNDTILGLCKKYSTSRKHDDEVEVVRRPSRIEALSMFIWKRYIASTQRVQPCKNYSVVLAVNLRTRFDPPLQPSVFGNLADVAVAMDTSPNENNHSKLVQSLRASLLKLSDPEHTKLYRNGEQLLPMIKEMYDEIYSENEVWICFTSVCKFPIRDADFGWGRPSAVNVDLPKMYRKNMVAFMDSNDGDGVDAWISFNKEEMEKFEVDPELLAHATWPC